jgi:hypothetical protein
LCDEIASKAGGILYDHCADAIALNPVEKSGEAWPALNRIGAAYSGIAEHVGNLETCVLGEAPDSLELPMLAIPVGTDIGGGARTNISNGLCAAY